jgi:hypothetical protein
MFSALYGPEGSLRSSQGSANGLNTKPGEFSQHCHTLYIRSVLILFSHPWLGLPSNVFLSCPPHPQMCKFLVIEPFALHVRSSYRCGHPNNVFWCVQIMKLQPHVAVPFFGPDIRSRVLFYNVLSLCSSLNALNRVSRPHEANDELSYSASLFQNKQTTNSVALFHERTIPAERPPLVGEVSANFCC